MSDFSTHGGDLTFTVRVVPRAARSSLAGVQEGVLRVRVAAPPVDGAANEELLRTLAKALGVPLRNVAITRGHTARIKHIRVTGADANTLQSVFANESVKK